METYIAYANGVAENEPGLSLWLAGLAGVILFSMKFGVGSGLAGLSKRELLATIASYSLFVAAIGAITAGGINLPAIFNLVGIFLGFYVILAIFMLAAGIYTVKSWQKGVDLSKKSFLPLIAPCPLLLVAIMLATGLLPGGAGDLNSILVGLLAGIVFFAIGIVTYYCTAKKVGGSSSPLVLGNLMIAVGSGLFAVVLILPTYFAIGLDLNNQYSAGIMGMMPIEHFLIVITFFVTFVLLGYVKGRHFKWD